ncbi:hypothetical protein ACJX0J_014701, partial [Zea mays]
VPLVFFLFTSFIGVLQVHADENTFFLFLKETGRIKNTFFISFVYRRLSCSLALDNYTKNSGIEEDIYGKKGTTGIGQYVVKNDNLLIALLVTKNINLLLGKEGDDFYNLKINGDSKELKIKGNIIKKKKLP